MVANALDDIRVFHSKSKRFRKHNAFSLPAKFPVLKKIPRLIPAHFRRACPIFRAREGISNSDLLTLFLCVMHKAFTAWIIKSNFSGTM